MGPYSVSGECIQSGSDTSTVVLEEGPGATVDEFSIDGTAAHSISVLAYPAHPTPTRLVGVVSTTSIVIDVLR